MEWNWVLLCHWCKNGCYCISRTIYASSFALLFSVFKAGWRVCVWKGGGGWAAHTLCVCVCVHAHTRLGLFCSTIVTTMIKFYLHCYVCLRDTLSCLKVIPLHGRLQLVDIVHVGWKTQYGVQQFRLWLRHNIRASTQVRLGRSIWNTLGIVLLCHISLLAFALCFIMWD